MVYCKFMGAYWKLTDAEFQAICTEVSKQPDDGRLAAFEVPEHSMLPGRPHVPAREIVELDHATVWQFRQFVSKG